MSLWEDGVVATSAHGQYFELDAPAEPVMPYLQCTVCCQQSTANSLEKTFGKKDIVLLQAIELDGAAALPHIAACTSMGRLALLSDNKTKVRLAHDAREEAVMALALEPSNDLAHHLMGRWHYEMANLNVVVRTLVRVMYGTALASGMPALY